MTLVPVRERTLHLVGQLAIEARSNQSRQYRQSRTRIVRCTLDPLGSSSPSGRGPTMPWINLITVRRGPIST
jgi:hypothetical protein